MKPPHFFCIGCGSLYVQGNLPKVCLHCDNKLFLDLGFETDYDKNVLEREYQEWKLSDEFSPELFWGQYNLINASSRD